MRRAFSLTLRVRAPLSLTMFESTLPFGEPDLMRVSAFQRYLGEMVRTGEADTASGRLSSLSPSLLQDLMRFENQERPGDPLELLEVLAGGVRHACSLLIHLQDQARVVPLTVFPRERLVHCPVPMAQLLETRLAELQVLHVERAVLRPPGDAEASLVGAPECYAPLGPLLWELALRGSREDLLPEIAGNAAYRIAPGANLRGLVLTGTLAQAVTRLKRHTTNLREIADWPGFDRARAMRLLNGLYLQAGLMVSRSHPAATNDGWFSGGR
jgi:hypothetical protein